MIEHILMQNDTNKDGLISKSELMVMFMQILNSPIKGNYNDRYLQQQTQQFQGRQQQNQENQYYPQQQANWGKQQQQNWGNQGR